MSFYKLEESRLIQYRSGTSAANALNYSFSYDPCPTGKCRVVTALGYIPSVAETQIVSVDKVNATAGMGFGILNPVSLNLNPAYATFIEQGMEYILFPADYLVVRRVAATAGSTMSVYIQFVEIDQPLYTYDEPHVVQKQKRVLSSVLRARIGGGGGRSGPGGSPGPIGHGGGGGTSIPV